MTKFTGSIKCRRIFYTAYMLHLLQVYCLDLKASRHLQSFIFCAQHNGYTLSTIAIQINNYNKNKSTSSLQLHTRHVNFKSLCLQSQDLNFWSRGSHCQQKGRAVLGWTRTEKKGQVQDSPSRGQAKPKFHHHFRF